MRKTFGPVGTLTFWLAVALMIAVGTDLNALSATKKPAGKAQNQAAQTPKDTNPQETTTASAGTYQTATGNASNQGGTGAGQTGAGGMDMSSMMKNMGNMMNMCPMMRARGSSNFEPVQVGYDIVDAKDYRAFDLAEARPELCQAACASEARCRAYTYTKPGTYGNPQARCWLKETQGRFVVHENAISAVKK